MTSRREQKEAARSARIEAERAAQRRSEARRRLQWAFGAFLVLAALSASAVALLAGGGGGGDRDRARAGAAPEAAPIPPVQRSGLRAAARAADAELIAYDYAYGIGDHVDGAVEYPTNPPTNGPHFGVPAEDGNYAGVEPPSTEAIVHSLEHGRIVIQYRPGLPARRIAQLVALYEEAPEHVLLVENRTRMDCDVAVTAWGHGMRCERFTDAAFDAIRAFRERYRDKGPEAAT